PNPCIWSSSTRRSTESSIPTEDPSGTPLGTLLRGPVLGLRRRREEPPRSASDPARAPLRASASGRRPGRVDAGVGDPRRLSLPRSEEHTAEPQSREKLV